MRTKYVLAKEGTFAIFAEHIMRNHVEVAADFMSKPHEEAESAGFVSINYAGELQCWGSSITLGKKSRPVEDSALLNEALHSGGIFVLPPDGNGNVILTNTPFGEPIGFDDLFKLRVFHEED
jgi:hypothetical protein